MNAANGNDDGAGPAPAPPVGGVPGRPSGVVPRLKLANPAQVEQGTLLKPRWGTWHAVIGLLLVIALPLAGTLVLVEVVPFGPALVFASLLLTWTAMLGTCLVASKKWGFGSLAKDFGLRFRWVDLVIGLGVGLAARVLLAVVLALLTALWPLEEGEVIQGNAELFLTGDTVWLVLNAVLGGILIAPFLEELFNRGLVLRAVQNAWWLRSPRSRHRVSEAVPRRSLVTATVISVLVSSLAFGLLHTGAVPDLRSSVYLLVGTFTVGLVCGLLTVWTGRLGPAIVTHVVFNGSAIGLLLIIPQELLQ
ncbi:type II CAAX endopeptidase family protein [Arthrobacter sp. H5]|uniref:CPBP family intramembrane glutamic endopeptidase n=1 Tax=Arthrobacter sp. H5 TaxID=1267973 RepID=UPI000488F60E|nr:type II CAAX endopeptidase family protein [Arthrobacter sp. H5]